MYKYSCLVVVFVITSLYNSVSLAAAWTKEEGSGQLITTFSGYSSKRYFSSEGDSQSSGVSLRKNDLNLLMEYGYRSDITFGFNPIIQKFDFKKNDNSLTINDFRECGVSSNRTFSNPSVSLIRSDIFLRKKILEKNSFVLSAQPLIKTPCLLFYNGDSYFINNTADYEFRLLGGYSFKIEKFHNMPFTGQYHFINFETAYRKRHSQFADQVLTDGTVGFHFNDRLLLMGQLFSVLSVGEENVRGTMINNQLFAEKDDFYSMKAQISAVQRIKERTSVQLAVYNEVLGKNSGNGSGALISIWYDF